MISGSFYSHYGGEPCFNMGFDEWLLERALDRPGSVALRLYQWKTGTITFGYNQRAESALVWSAVGATPVIRRVTGGRALYHDSSELTYSIVINQEELRGVPLGGSLSESSGAISEALVGFLESLGIRSEYQRSSSSSNSRPDFFHKAPCFASSAKYEVMGRAGKLIASAQKRLGHCLLQHGSIKLRGVVPHPALPSVPETVAVEFGALEGAEFSRLAELFGGSMGKSLGVAFLRDEAVLTQELHLREAVGRVEKNPYERRELIAHSGRANGL
jgi:lipoate-protein ligase A